MSDLKNKDGLLHSVLERVKHDDTLMLAIRNDYINIYYRGGNLLRINENKDSYRFHFDNKYNTANKEIPARQSVVKNISDAGEWVDAFSCLKEIMDLWFSDHPKSEREFQQLIVRENNCSAIAKSSEYFISDIEFATSEPSARFDMMAIRRFAKKPICKQCRAALIEVKYGDGALGGKAGIIKHLKDMDTLISDPVSYSHILETISNQFNQLNKLGLLNFSEARKDEEITLDTDDKPEVIFVLANHNPRGKKLATILSDPDITRYSERFDLKFFVARFAGYGFYSHCMLNLEQFQKLLER